MEDLIRIAGGATLVWLAQWMVRWAVRAELQRAGIFRAERPLSERETQEVMALIGAGKFNAAEALRDRYRFQIHRPR